MGARDDDFYIPAQVGPFYRRSDPYQFQPGWYRMRAIGTSASHLYRHTSHSLDGLQKAQRLCNSQTYACVSLASAGAPKCMNCERLAHAD